MEQKTEYADSNAKNVGTLIFLDRRSVFYTGLLNIFIIYKVHLDVDNYYSSPRVKVTGIIKDSEAVFF